MPVQRVKQLDSRRPGTDAETDRHNQVACADLGIGDRTVAGQQHRDRTVRLDGDAG